MINPDFKDLLQAFNAAEVRYLVVGAYAVTFHAQPRFTNDLDLRGTWTCGSRRRPRTRRACTLR